MDLDYDKITNRIRILNEKVKAHKRDYVMAKAEFEDSVWGYIGEYGIEQWTKLKNKL